MPLLGFWLLWRELSLKPFFPFCVRVQLCFTAGILLWRMLVLNPVFVLLVSRLSHAHHSWCHRGKWPSTKFLSFGARSLIWESLLILWLPEWSWLLIFARLDRENSPALTPVVLAATEGVVPLPRFFFNPFGIKTTFKVILAAHRELDTNPDFVQFFRGCSPSYHSFSYVFCWWADFKINFCPSMEGHSPAHQTWGSGCYIGSFSTYFFFFLLFNCVSLPGFHLLWSVLVLNPDFMLFGGSHSPGYTPRISAVMDGFAPHPRGGGHSPGHLS